MAMLVYQRVTPRISPNLRLVRLVRALPRGFLLCTMLEPLVQDGHVERPAGCVSLEKKDVRGHFYWVFIGFDVISGWCLEHELYFSIGNGKIIPTDEVIFFRGVGLNHQPDIHMMVLVTRMSKWAIFDPWQCY